MFWFMVGAVFLFVIGHVFSFMLEGTSGITGTTLSEDISAAVLFVPITSDDGFLAADSRVFIDDEEIAYDSIQQSVDANCTTAPCLVLSAGDRGINDTEAAAHSSGTEVLTETAGLINQAVSFRIGSVDTITGAIAFPFQAIFALGKFFAKLVMWDYSYLTGNAVFIKYILLYPLSGGFLVGMISLFREAFSAVFGR